MNFKDFKDKFGFDRDRGREDKEVCDDPECESCGGSGWIEVCRCCDKPLAKHSYKQQLKCMMRMGK